MGVDAQAFSRVLPKSFFGHLKNRKALEAVNRAARSWAEANEFEPFYESTFSEQGTLYISFYPLGDSIQFDANESVLSVGFRGSNGGPGYHVAAIELLDFLEKTLTLSWDWSITDDTCSDESGYGVTRDFVALQNYMAKFLYNLMDYIQEHSDGTGAVCIPFGLGQSSERLSCPLGTKLSSWAREYVTTPTEQRSQLAKTFFPWWEQGRNSLFWESTLRGMLWQYAQWRVPLTDKEALMNQRISYVEDKLSLLQPLPEDLTTALREWKSAITEEPSSQKTDIGYLKSIVSHTPLPGWRLCLPGTMIINEECDEINAVQYFDDQVALYVSSITATLDAPKPYSWSESENAGTVEKANGLSFRCEKTTHAEDGSYSQFYQIVHETDTQLDILLLTMTVSTPDQFSKLKDIVDQVRFVTSGN